MACIDNFLGVGFLGKLVADRRNGRAMTQAQLAQKLGVQPGTISNLERGFTKSLNTGKLGDLARALEIPIDELMRAASGDRDALIVVTQEAYEGLRQAAKKYGHKTVESYLETLAIEGVTTRETRRLRPPSANHGAEESRTH
jgi:transcriptional regulator with XRE-family HTH domain